MTRLFHIASFLFCMSLLFACQKVVKIDLNSADPRIVIEAEISDQPGPYYVRLTQTVNFDQPNVFPPVKGAVVKLSDDAGHMETLTETAPGIYQTSTMAGTPGRIYTLSVTSGNKTYTATSAMYASVPLDSLGIKKGLFRDVRNLHVYFTDPAGVKNWYRFVKVVNDTISKDIFIDEDILQDGQSIDELLFTAEQDTLSYGDSVVIRLQNIDQGAFDYWRTMMQLNFQGPQAPTPANPKSNFSNGALGYFSAYAETKKSVTVK